jgi:ATP-dependent RNA helicase RhlB
MTSMTKTKGPAEPQIAAQVDSKTVKTVAKKVVPKKPKPKISSSQEELFSEKKEKSAVQKSKKGAHLPVKKTNDSSLILQPETLPAPQYTLPRESSQVEKPLRFENLIANERVLQAVYKTGARNPSKILQKFLPAALRGSDVLLFKLKNEAHFFLGALPVVTRFLSENIQKGLHQAPGAFFVCSSQRKADEFFSESKGFFEIFGISVAKIEESCSQEDCVTLFSQPVDFCVATPKALRFAVEEAKTLSFKNTGFCAFLDCENLSKHHKDDLERYFFPFLPAERVQKIFVSSENLPFVREFAFKFLENPERISVLPAHFSRQHPKQLAYTLLATQKFQVLLGHLNALKPKTSLVFANTSAVAEWIAYKLHGNGIKVELVTTFLNQQKRQILTKMLAQDSPIVVVTTDFVSKNFGFCHLNCLYHFDLPDSPAHFIERLSKIVGIQDALAISFVCEDYGFNMKAIENTLGFSLPIVIPNQSFFELKDRSHYPLEQSGKVKRIGVVYEQEEMPALTPKEPKASALQETPRTTSSSARSSVESQSHKLYRRPLTPLSVSTEQEGGTAEVAAAASGGAGQGLHHDSVQQKAGDRSLQQNGTAAAGVPPAEKGSFGRQEAGGEKFNRRDDRAREALEAARRAAKIVSEKRSEAQKEKSHTTGQKSGLFDIVTFLIQDALVSAAVAAKNSLATNIHKNLPSVAGFLERRNILKKQKSDNDKN